MSDASGNGDSDPRDEWSPEEFERLIEKRNREAWRSSWGRSRRKRAADREYHEATKDKFYGYKGCHGALVLTMACVVVVLALLSELQAGRWPE